MLLSIILAMGVVISGRGKRMEAVRTELNTAARIQESMLPRVFPPFPKRDEFEIYAGMDPAREVGGDLYDFHLIDDDHLALVIADVSDKGVPAALLMMSAKILIGFRARMGGTPARYWPRSTTSCAKTTIPTCSSPCGWAYWTCATAA